MTHIEISIRDRAQVLRLARPEKRNALTLAMYKRLSDALEAGDRDPGIAAHVLVGAPGIFTAGNDLNDFLAAEGGAAVAEILRFIGLLPRIAKPLIAAVDGPAVGIGATLLLHCDLVYATPRTHLSTPFTDLGLVPEAASSLLLPYRIGHQRAFALLALGETLTAEAAREAGLINATVSPDALEETAFGAARRLALKPPEALAATRRLLRGADEAAITDRIAEEAVIFRQRLATPEARAAFRAFLEKRPPDFVRASAPAGTSS